MVFFQLYYIGRKFLEEIFSASYEWDYLAYVQARREMGSMTHVPSTLTSKISGASVLLRDSQSVIYGFILRKYIESEPMYLLMCVS